MLCCLKRCNSNCFLINTDRVAQAGTFCKPLPLENLTGIRDTKVRYHKHLIISHAVFIQFMIYHFSCPCMNVLPLFQCGRSHISKWKVPIKSKLDNGKKVGSAKAYYWLQRMPLPAFLIRFSSQLFKANIPSDVTRTTNANIIQKYEHKCIDGGRGYWLKHDEVLIYLLRWA